MTNNVKALLSWLLGPIGGVIFLSTEKEDKLIRLHAAQSIVTFVLYLILAIVIGFLDIGIVSFSARILYTVITILGVVKAYHGEMYKFPVISDLATSIILKDTEASAVKEQKKEEVKVEPQVEQDVEEPIQAVEEFELEEFEDVEEDTDETKEN